MQARVRIGITTRSHPEGGIDRHRSRSITNKVESGSSIRVNKYQEARTLRCTASKRVRSRRKQKVQETLNKITKQVSSSKKKKRRRRKKENSAAQNLISKYNLEPRPLPAPLLFQHKARTWFGLKKKKDKTEVQEDWRNTLRPQSIKKKTRSKNISSVKM